MTIVAAIDHGTNDDRVVATAADLASAYGDELVVVHVVSEERFRADHGRRPNYFQDDAVEDAEAAAREVVEAALGDAGAASAVGRFGEPTAQILDVADEHDARYVVIGGRKRTPVGKALFGSITQSVLLTADRPIVAVMAPDE